MKPKKVKEILKARIRQWEQMKDKQGYRKPGSQQAK